MPALVVDAVAAGHTVQLVVPREKRWKITRRDGVGFFYWANTERWFSARFSDNVQGYTADGLRHWLGLEKQAA